jgi:hypothetical protein
LTDGFNKSLFHHPPMSFYPLQGMYQFVMLRRAFVENAGLLRTQIPRAYEGALDTIQSATGRTVVAAAFSPLSEELPIRWRNICQVEKQQVPEIGPHPRPPAATVFAGGAGRAAECIHARKDRIQLSVQFPGQAQGVVQPVTVPP